MWTQLFWPGIAGQFNQAIKSARQLKEVHDCGVEAYTIKSSGDKAWRCCLVYVRGSSSPIPNYVHDSFQLYIHVSQSRHYVNCVIEEELRACSTFSHALGVDGPI